MQTEEFNKYEYQNLLCEHDLSGLEMRILIRLSNCYGTNGLICPSNAKLAIWLGKITQEEYNKPDKTKEEQKKLKLAKGSIKTVMKKLNDKRLIETEKVGNSRKIFLLKPQHDKEKDIVRYEGSKKLDPLNTGGHQNSTPGLKNSTPGSRKIDPLIINSKNNNKINNGSLPKNVNGQVTTLLRRTPIDVRNTPAKKHKTAIIVRAGINAIGFDLMDELINKMQSESHRDYPAALEIKINEVVQ